MERILAMNIALMRSMQLCIQETPRQFHIADWQSGDITPGAQSDCGGAACFAGWACVLACKVRLSEMSNVAIERLAREVLGLSEAQADRLFVFSKWPEVLQERYRYNARSPEDYRVNANVAAWRLEVFILSDGEI